MTSITLIAMAIIAIIAILYFVPLISLSAFFRKLKKAKDMKDLNKSNKLLEDISLDYIQTIIIDVEGEKKTFHHSEEFFNAREFARAIGVNLKHINSAPGVLSGLGVLGTFVGLAFSVSTFDSGSSEAIMSSIKILLSGMGTAFMTSLVGMFFSAVYIFCQKCVYNSMENAISVFTKGLDNKNYVSPEEVAKIENDNVNQIVLARLADINRTNEDQKTAIIAELAKLSEQIEKNKESLLETVISYDEDGNVITSGNILLSLYEESEKQSQALQSFTTDLSNELNSSLGKTMDASIVPLIQDLEKSHELMCTRLDKLSDSLQTPVTNMVDSAISGLQSSMQTMADEFKNQISKETISQMEILAQNLAQAGEMLNTLPQTMQNMSEQVVQNFCDIRTLMNGVQASFVQQQNDMQESNRNSTEKILGEFQQRVMIMSEGQESALNRMTDQLNTLSASITSQLKTAAESLFDQQSGIEDSRKKMSVELDALLSSFRQSIQNLKDTNSTNVRTIESMQIAGKNLNESLQTITEMLTASVSDATSRMSDMLQNASNSLKDSLQNATDKLNESANKVESMISEQSDASRDIMLQNQESLDKFEEIQKDCQRTIFNLTQFAAKTEKMMSDYIQEFDTIKSGLSAIFENVHNGLIDYSNVVRESTGNSLGEFKEAVVSSSKALMNVAESLKETVDELSEDVTNLKNSRR